MLPPSQPGNCRLFAAIMPEEMGWLEAPGPCNSPHSVSERNLFKSSQGHTSPKSSSAYFTPGTKNVLARVKSDNSLKHQILNNQKLIQDNLCVGTGSCDESHILLSMAGELCIGVSTSGCSHYDHWQTHILSKYPVLVIYYCPKLEVSWLTNSRNLSPSLPHWCAATHAHWLMYQERQTLVMKH